jgi:hypothetical protein
MAMGAVYRSVIVLPVLVWSFDDVVCSRLL